MRYTQGRHMTDEQRDQEVLELLSRGLTNPEMADAIGMSVQGVHGRVSTMLRRMNARNRTHAVALAYQKRILPVPVDTAVDNG